MEKARDVRGSQARDGQGSKSTKNSEVVQGMCVLGSKGCVCVGLPRMEERVRGEGKGCVWEQGKGCVWE